MVIFHSYVSLPEGNMKKESQANPTGFKNWSIKIRKAWARWSWSPSNFPVDVCHYNLSKRKRKTIKRYQKNIETTSESNPVCQVFGIAASALYFHLRVPFDAVGIGQNHPPLGIDHETGPAGTVLPSPLPWQRKVGGAVDAPNLSVPRKFGSRWVDVVHRWQREDFLPVRELFRPGWTRKTLVESNWNHLQKLPNTAKFACSFSIETLTTESNGTPKPSSPSSSSSQLSQAPKASSSSLSSGLPTGRRPFFLVPSLLPLRTGVSSACPAPSRSRLRTMAAGRKGGPFVNEEFSILVSIKSILSCLSYNCGVFGWRSRTVTFVWWSVVGGCSVYFAFISFWSLTWEEMAHMEHHQIGPAHAFTGTIWDNNLKPGPQSGIAFGQVFQKVNKHGVP